MVHPAVSRPHEEACSDLHPHHPCPLLDRDSLSASTTPDSGQLARSGRAKGSQTGKRDSVIGSALLTGGAIGARPRIRFACTVNPPLAYGTVQAASLD